MKNKKIFLYSFIFILFVGLSYYLKTNKEHRDQLKLYFEQSENPREIYTGKVSEVYNPLDEAYKITPELLKLKENKIKDTYSTLPILSLWIDPEELYSKERGIISNNFKKGRLWERAGYLNYILGEKVEFESFVGVRLHGNGSRKKKVKSKNYRFYFRKKYGEKELPLYLSKGLTFGEGATIKRLVMRREDDFNFNNHFLSYLIHELGGKTSKFRHVMFYLNGKKQGMYTITEHLSFDQVKRSIGHENFVWARLRGDNSITDKIHFSKLEAFFDSFWKPRVGEIASRIDMDSIISTYVTVMFTGNGDWYQGLYFKNLKEKNSKWLYFPWDFDGAFNKSWYNRYDGVTENYTVGSVQVIIDKKKYSEGILPDLFRRLAPESTEFRAHLSQKINKLFDVLNSDKTKKLLEFYQELATESGYNHPQRSFNNIQEFLQKRKPIFCRDLRKFLKLVPSACEN